MEGDTQRWGLPQGWYFVLLPEPLLSKGNAVDVIFCCSALFVQPGLQLNSERDDQYIFFSQHSPMLAAALLSIVILHFQI
jgi:hypothetical protein